MPERFRVDDAARGIAELHQGVVSGCRVAEANAGTQPPGSRRGGQEVRGGRALGIAEARNGFVVPPLGEPQDPTGEGQRDARFGIAHSRQRPRRAVEPQLRVLQPAPREDTSTQRQVRAAHDRVLGPAEPVGELDRLATAILGHVGLLPEVRDVRQVAETCDGDVRPSDAASELEAFLQVALGVVELESPELGEPDAHQRERAEVDVDP